jgi:hypothetical protein
MNLRSPTDHGIQSTESIEEESREEGPIQG